MNAVTAGTLVGSVGDPQADNFGLDNEDLAIWTAVRVGVDPVSQTRPFGSAVEVCDLEGFDLVCLGLRNRGIP
jgi:hypothetical protein